MTQERLSMRTIREVLRLKHEIGLSNRAIARACRISNSTVGEYKQAGWSWPLPEEVSEEELYRRLFPEGEKPKGTERPVPNWEEIHRDLSLWWIETSMSLLMNPAFCKIYTSPSHFSGMVS